MGVFNEHGQLRWDANNQSAEYIVAWSINDDQASLDGSINYILDRGSGYVAPKVQTVTRTGGITIINSSGSAIVKLEIAPGSTPKAAGGTAIDLDGPYYAAVTQGYMSGATMDNGTHVVADAFVTALAKPKDTSQPVNESTEFEEKFKIEIILTEPNAIESVEVCYYDVPTKTWKLAKDIGATVTTAGQNQVVTIETTKLGQYVVTSPTAPVTLPQGDPNPYQKGATSGAATNNDINTITEAVNSVAQAAKAAAEAAQAAVAAVTDSSGNSAA